MWPHKTALTQYITAKNTKFAYRLFGATGGVPLVCLQHFRGTIDHWDPLLVSTLAKSRPVLLLDNSGVGKSSGSVSEDFAEWAINVVSVCDALNLDQIDVLGFSIGSFVAQYLALNAPDLVRRVILASASPSAGPGVEDSDPDLVAAFASATTLDENEAVYVRGFYSPNENKQKLAKQWWKRMNEAWTDEDEERSDYVGPNGTQAQITALTKWSTLTDGDDGTYDRVGSLTLPVFVAAGANDTIVPTANSVLLAKMIPTAHLHIYPDVGHGFLNEYAALFAAHIDLFLE